MSIKPPSPLGCTCPNSLKECFEFDKHEFNPIPKGVLRKILSICLTSRYSMPVLMRVSQYYFLKGNAFSRMLSAVLRRCNQSFNNFEHAANPLIASGVVFHHTGVCITSATVIESGVHIYRNVTFGIKDGLAPHICANSKCASHSVILGGVVVGERSIVAPGAVVIKDVPPGKIVAGVPAEIIGDVTDENYVF